MAAADAPVDPEVQKWLEENAISTGKADINPDAHDGGPGRNQNTSDEIHWWKVHSGLMRGLQAADDASLVITIRWCTVSRGADPNSATETRRRSRCVARPTEITRVDTKFIVASGWTRPRSISLFGQLKAADKTLVRGYEPKCNATYNHAMGR